MRIGIRKFGEGPAGHLKTAVQTEETLEVTYHGRPYAAVTSSDRMARLELADDIVRGLLQLARRGEDCDAYRSYVEAIERIVSAGHLDLDTDIGPAIAMQDQFETTT